MRVLVACPECARQFDTSGRSAGSSFRCLCGIALRVPEPRAHDAAVVRCSACGAPRQQGTSACGYCGADFTLHERDLHTLCPACMARVSDRARYCHHCATPLLPQPLGPATAHSCPACGEVSQLASRSLDGDRLPVLECQRCAGLWLGRGAFGIVLDRARREARIEAGQGPPRPEPTAPQDGSLYRPCPECGALMHRVNYGRRSGVIVDSCGAHGLWFDARELDALLRWIRQGGEAHAARRDGEERAHGERQKKLLTDLRSESGGMGASEDKPWLIDALGALLSRLID